MQRLGRGAARHHWLVLAAWLILAIAAATAASAFGGPERDTFSVPGTGSQQALELLEQRFPEAAAGNATVVFSTSDGSKVTDSANQSAIEATVKKLEDLPDLSSVSDPFTQLPPPLPRDISPNGQVAFTTINFTKDTAGLPRDLFSQIEAATEPARSAGMEVAYSGGVVDLALADSGGGGGVLDLPEEIGLAFAVVILVLALGSVVAMLVPIGSALIGLAVSISLLGWAAGSFTIGTAVPAIGTMIGLGVGIDYSLFITSRFRQNLDDGDDVITAAGRASATAGSAVLFAGVTVCIALVGLTLVGIPYVSTMGIAAAIFVAVAVLSALTLIPALLGLLGHRVNSLSIHRRGRGDETNGLSARWARTVVRRPALFAAVGLVVMIVLAIPVLRIDMAFPTAADNPPGNTEREAYDRLTEGFGAGVNGPLLVAIELPAPTASDVIPEIEAAVKLVGAINDTDGVKSALGPIPNKDGTAAIIQVTPSNGPDDPQTKALVTTLRDQTIPNTLNGSAINPDQVFVGGQTAILIDLSTLIVDRLPWFIGGVVLLTFFLLMMVFRSILVPLKAAVMNILSIGAAYGVLVAVFQWGWARGLIGLQETLPIAPIVPVMMFAILFGLSMDYEVFLLSRMREEWERTGDHRLAVVNGLARTARVITAAALIMITVFGAFVLNPNAIVKMMGFGMAVAVLVDATVVRMLLVPSVMELFGRRAWWLPAWLDRILPHLNVDAEPQGDGPEASTPTRAATDPVP